MVEVRKSLGGGKFLMSVTLKRQLDDDEKAIVLKRFGRVCFATGHEIPEGETIQFDHIKAFSLDGPTEVNNIAPMCGKHNGEKGALPLQDFRTKLKLQEFFSLGDKLTLRDFLGYLQKLHEIDSFGEAVSVKPDTSAVTIQSPAKTYSHIVYCPTTGWQYFYATLDVNILDSDDEKDSALSLQPRYLIVDRVFELYRHFQEHPVLQPSIGRVVDSHIRLFDGQHKIAALLLNGRREFECKVYLSSDLRLLNETNIAAHDKFAQVRFYSSIMVLKLGSLFGADFEQYKALEDGQAKSEAGFLEYLKRKDGTLTPGQIRERFRDYLYTSVLDSAENRLAGLVSASNRGTREKPITIDLLSKSLFSAFLYREPTEDNMATEAYKRDDEAENLIAMMNMLFDEALAFLDPKISANDNQQIRLSRIFASKSMMAWSELLKDAIVGKLELHDSDEQARPFYRKLSSPDLERVRSAVRRLLQWSRWQAPTGDQIDRVLADRKSTVKTWFRDQGLTISWLMGAPS
jgi:hypothetical protein